MLNLNDHRKKTAIAGVPLDAYSYFITQTLEKTGSLKRSILCLVESGEDLNAFESALGVFSPQTSVLIFPDWDCLPYDKISPSAKVMGQRLCTLSSLIHNPHQIILTTTEAVSHLLPPKKLLTESIFMAKESDRNIREILLNYLLQKGYHRVDTVRQIGDYAIRGSLIDLYPANELNPLRLDFFDEDLESIKEFSVETQLSLCSRQSVNLVPISEVILIPETVENFRHNYRKLFGTQGQQDPLYQSITNEVYFQGAEHWLPLFYKDTEKFLDYLDQPLIIQTTRVWDNFDKFEERLQHSYIFRKEILNSQADPYRPIVPETFYFSEHHLKKQFSTQAQIELTSFNPKDAEDFGARSLHSVRFNHKNRKENYSLLKEHLVKTSKKVIFAASTPGSLEVMKTTLETVKISAKTKKWPEIRSEETGVFLITLPIKHGFETPEFEIITEEDLYGTRLSRKPARTAKLKNKSLLEVTQFQEGDFLTHEDYGIGKYNGLVVLVLQGAQHDCLCLTYDEGDKLYVPVENLNVLSFYAHKFSETFVDKLGTSAWQVRKAKAQEKIKEMAGKLAKIAAQRQLVKTQSYAPGPEFEEFCNRFPYPETEDQERSIQEVLEDLSKDTPMDRLICGDVGFGKTEIALRAAFIVSRQKTQVALLAPTTILARQHFEIFQRRFQGFSVKISLLSRFQSASESKKIRESVEKGDIDIIIGTHSLLSSSSKFSNLGLLIIDEEQHFGVNQKERIKSLYPQVHILSLSATPIPRTLQLAVNGIRDLSLITTPPIERLPVITWVMPYDDLTIKEALIREQQRGGQSFFVCPRVADIGHILNHLSKLLPHFKLAVAHGGVPSKDLEKIMIDFCNRRYDVLIATNIIESGLDIPSANTLIVYRSDLFGLAQAYQLRGRVGRSKAQGYAYFTFTQDKTLTQTAERRFEVLQSLRSLGASFQIASYDMDIRGSGNILGEEQSGQIENVGVGLYQQMLEEALMEIKQNPDDYVSLKPRWTPQINFGLEVLIPPSYIPDESLRLSIYKRISELSNEQEITNMQIEMTDRFGSLPQQLRNLFQIIGLRNLCKELNIHKLESGPNGILVTFYKNIFLDTEKMMRFIQKSYGTIKARPDQKLVIMKSWKNPSHLIKGMMDLLTDFNEL